MKSFHKIADFKEHFTKTKKKNSGSQEIFYFSKILHKISKKNDNLKKFSKKFKKLFISYN